MKETLKFLRDLKRNNNREWFAANRERYEHALQYTRSLTQELIDRIAELDPSAAMLSVGDCTYRIYRDTRFSPDKTPYKTHIGIFINPPGGKKAPSGGYYFHIEPGQCFIAAGNVCHPPKVLAAIRKSIVDNIEEYDEMLCDPEFRGVFPTVGENMLKTAPKGVDKDWPYVEYVRPRDYVASTATVASLETWLKDSVMLRRILEQAFRYNRFLNYAVEETLGSLLG